MKNRHEFIFLVTAAIVVCTAFAAFLVYATEESDFAYSSPPDKGNRFFDMFYFALSTATTVGYGDIAPKTKRARLYTTIFQLILFGGVISLLFDFELSLD
jgi:hypothetical protein